MSKLKTKKIHINNIKPNMILAEDAVSKTGLSIIAKNTVLTKDMYDKLNSNGIRAITIFEKTGEEDKKEENTKKEDKKEKNIKKEENEKNTKKEESKRRQKNENVLANKSQEYIGREDFEKFKSLYHEKIEMIENQFVSIGDGFGIELDGVYRGITDIVKSVRCKSDIFSFMSKLQKKDDKVYEHCLNVSLVANLFALWLGYSDEKVKDITLAGLLHDIGKMKIKDSIIKKDGKLTEEEYEIMKKHSSIGYNLIKDFPLPEDVKLAVLMHHEKMDGSGYPLGLKDDKICHTAKIIAICDIYEAMTADNYYRKRHCPFEVIDRLEKDYYNLLDTKLLLAFLQNISYTYIGSNVLLSNGIEAKVVFINQNCFSKPMVRVDDNFIDLFEQDICINEVL